MDFTVHAINSEQAKYWSDFDWELLKILLITYIFNCYLEKLSKKLEEERVKNSPNIVHEVCTQSSLPKFFYVELSGKFNLYKCDELYTSLK